MIIFIYSFPEDYWEILRTLYDCENCKNISPFTQVLIQESPQLRYVAVGVVYKDHNLHVLPGHNDGTLGYHIDDGKIFYQGHQKYGRELKGKFI